MKEDDVNEDAEREQFIQWFEAGRYMKQLRGKRPLTEVAKALDLSTNYISNVERGRVPSDHFIQAAAAYYNVSEDELFIKWGKVPILARDIIQNSVSLQRTIAQIGRTKDLNDEEKEELYDEIYQTYDRYMKKKAAREAALKEGKKV